MMHRIVDFHSHILPQIDDGSRSVEESLAMLRMEAEQGVGHVVATPHFYPQHDDPARFLARREKAELLLREAMAGLKDMPKLSIGAEVYYFNGISDSDAVSELTIDKKNGILIEMPNTSWTDTMYRELEGLYVKRGLIPIIAHLDRYLTSRRSLEIPARLAELPVLVQVNAEFFLHWSTARRALRMLKNNNIHLLGSDCHNLRSRTPNLESAVDVIRKRLGDSPLERICSYEQLVLGEQQNVVSHASHALDR